MTPPRERFEAEAKEMDFGACIHNCYLCDDCRQEIAHALEKAHQEGIHLNVTPMTQTAYDAGRSTGRRKGLEEAAKLCDERSRDPYKDIYRSSEARKCAFKIREIIDGNPEKKP